MLEEPTRRLPPNRGLSKRFDDLRTIVGCTCRGGRHCFARRHSRQQRLEHQRPSANCDSRPRLPRRLPERPSTEADCYSLQRLLRPRLERPKTADCCGSRPRHLQQPLRRQNTVAVCGLRQRLRLLHLVPPNTAADSDSKTPLPPLPLGHPLPSASCGFLPLHPRQRLQPQTLGANSYSRALPRRRLLQRRRPAVNSCLHAPLRRPPLRRPDALFSSLPPFSFPCFPSESYSDQDPPGGFLVFDF